MTMSLIVAMAANRVIGRGNGLPWRLPADLRRFKALTLGHSLIVGRRTLESIGRALPDRHMIVVTRQPAYRFEGVIVAASVDDALDLATSEEVFIGGGAEIFRETLPRAHRLHMTYIDADICGDTFFPEYDESAWRLSWEERHGPGEGADFEYAFRIYDQFGVATDTSEAYEPRTNRRAPR